MELDLSSTTSVKCLDDVSSHSNAKPLVLDLNKVDDDDGVVFIPRSFISKEKRDKPMVLDLSQDIHGRKSDVSSITAEETKREPASSSQSDAAGLLVGWNH